MTPEKKATQPPPRFNEASLVKFLEENGIGRPSTYAEILRKIEEREYVRKKDRRFIPTALGRTVIELLIPYFDDFFETSYTARMEEALDDVEEGKLSWTQGPHGVRQDVHARPQPGARRTWSPARPAFRWRRPGSSSSRSCP